MNSERIFLDEMGTHVSTSRVIVAGTTYPTANITSIQKRFTKPKTAPAYLLILLGLIMMGNDAMSGGLFFLVVGILWRISLKKKYHITFSAASGELRALESKDESYIDRVIGAINEAIVARG